MLLATRKNLLNMILYIAPSVLILQVYATLINKCFHGVFFFSHSFLPALRILHPLSLVFLWFVTLMPIPLCLSQISMHSFCTMKTDNSCKFAPIGPPSPHVNYFLTSCSTIPYLLPTLTSYLYSPHSSLLPPFHISLSLCLSFSLHPHLIQTEGVGRCRYCSVILPGHSKSIFVRHTQLGKFVYY